MIGNRKTPFAPDLRPSEIDQTEPFMDVADFPCPRARPLGIPSVVGQQDAIALEMRTAASRVCNDRIERTAIKGINLLAGEILSQLNLSVVRVQRTTAILNGWRADLAAVGRRTSTVSRLISENTISCKQPVSIPTRYAIPPVGRSMGLMRWQENFAFAAGVNTAVDQMILLFFVGCGVSRLARYNVTAESLSAQTGRVEYFEGTPIPTSVVPLGLLMLAFYGGSLYRVSLLGVEWHAVALLFLVSGSLMISKTLRIPKP